MATALVGGAFLSSFLNVIFDRLSSPEVINWLKAKKVDDKLIGRLERSLCVVQAVLNDAEQRQITDPYVKKWLSNLEDAVYKADDLLDEVRTKAATTHKEDPGNIWTRYFNSQDSEMVSRIQEVIGTLEELAKHKDILSLKEVANAIMPRRIQTTSLVDRSEIFGRDEDKEKIIELLLSDTSDAAVSVIPIVGMGGVGKTTLSQLVYNDDKLEGKFDCKAWVCVGEEFDIVKVTKSILSAVTSSSCDKVDLNLLQNDLKQELSGKKFLVVLDDMWNDRPDEWKILKKPFLYGNKGGVVLVTTRSDDVAFVVHTLQPYKLELLPKEHCWSLFVKHAFNSTESLEFSTLEEIGRIIVEKCKGLPLAVETLGTLLRTNYDANYWDSILKSEFWQTPEDKMGIIPALRISYQYLPSHLKRCFVFCSLYPKDHKFDKDELILLWMAEDFFVQPNGVKTLEEIGHEYFNELVARSFFQPSNTHKGLFVMHDLIHDLAMLCAGEFYFRDEPGKAKEIGNVSIKTRHLSHDALGKKLQISNLLKACDRVEHSRTFLIFYLGWQFDSNMDDAICILLSHLECFRVLSLHNFPLLTLPHSIGALIHMRYLDLSQTLIVKLPESLSRLYNLQTLKLKSCYNLKTLPRGMQDLVNLRHLDISGTISLKEMPKGMSKLEHLQFLSRYIVGKDEENTIRELGTLVNLHGSLCISHLENVINDNEALEARMSDKMYVNSLDLRWSPNSKVADSKTERDILDKLQPHPDLKELSIYDYKGTKFPDWLGYSSYKHMTRLTLYGCENCCMLPSLGQLPSLKYLRISNFDSLTSIGAEFYRGDESCQKTPFPSIETLFFHELKCWQEWHSIEYAFPQLKELMISNCPELIKNLPSHLPKLEKLIIDETCKKLECFLPRAPSMLELDIPFIINGLRMQELPPSICSLRIRGSQLVESVFEAMSRTQPTRLQSLYMSECDSVISFPGDCVPASLQFLEIYGCKKLDFPTSQQHQSLLELTISCSCDSLVSFPLNVFPNLCELEISGCENMESLVVSQSQDASNSRLGSLTIDDCPKFVSLSSALGMVAPQLEYLTISDCPEIESFGVDEGGLPSNLKDLVIEGCEKLGSRLASMDLSSSHSLAHLHIEGASESVKSFPKEGCLPASLRCLKLSGFPSLETMDCNGLSYLTSLRTLYIWKCEKMENMTGETLPASLTYFSIVDCPVLGERCKEKNPLIWPKISHIEEIRVNGTDIS